MAAQLISSGLPLGPNELPYEVPLHPLLVHLTLGLFIVAILFDIAASLFPLEQPVLKFFRLIAIREGFSDVGWYNLLACACITFFTVTAGVFEILLADPPRGVTSSWGFSAGATMLMHAVGGMVLMTLIVSMTFWRGLLRHRRRERRALEVSWSYLASGVVMIFLLYLHGTLGAQLGEEFGLHNTVVHLLRQGIDPNAALP